MTKKIYFIRHELIEHKHLNREGVERARATGNALEKRGIVIDWVASSPQWRCVQTIYHLLWGGKFDIPFGHVDSRLSDLSSDPEITPETKTFIAERCQQENVTKTDVIYREDSLRDHILRRGVEGAEALNDCVKSQPGKNLLICSHGGSRMEPTISTLIGSDVFEPPFLLERGEIAMLLFDNLSFKSVEYLGHIA